MKIKKLLPKFFTKGKPIFWKWLTPLLGVVAIIFASLDYFSTQDRLEKEKQIETKNYYYQAMDLFGAEVKYGSYLLVQLNPKKSDDFKNKQKRLEEARRLIEKIEFFSPEDEKVHVLRFIYFVLLDDLESAKSELKKFEKDKERITDANVHFMMGMLFSLNRKDNDKAMLLFERAVQLAPNYAAGRIMFAFFLHNIGMNERSIQQLQHAIVLEPGNIAAFNALAHVLLESGKIDDAKSIWLDLVKRGVANGKTYNSLGVISALQNEHSRAIEYYKKATEMWPREGFFYFNLSLSYAALGQNKEAAEAKKLALNYGLPDDVLKEKTPYQKF